MTTVDDDDEPSEKLLNEVMSVLSIMSPKELAEFAAWEGTPLADWQDVVAAWRARRQ